MNSRERIAKILAHQEADRVPVYPLVNSISWKYTGIGYDEWSVDAEKCAEAIIKATDTLDLDVITTLVDLSVEAADWGMDVAFYPDKAGMPSEDKLIVENEDYLKIKHINPRETKRMSMGIKLTEILARERGAEKPIVGFVFAPMGILSMMSGMEKLMKDCIRKKTKPFIMEAMEQITLTIIEYCEAICDAGADAIMLDTLFASKSIMRASMWDEFEGPFVERIAEAIHAKGKEVMIHNCGEGIYFKEQIARMKPCAISMLYLPPDCETMQELKDTYGKDVTIIGHVDPGYLMVADEAGLRAQCQEMINTYKKDGGFVLATGCEYPSLLDDTFAKIMVDEAKTTGLY